MPTEFGLDRKSIKVSYKFLADSGRLMLVLTDITQTTLLTETVERERKRLEMIVLAVTEGEAFAALVSDYEKFLTEELPQLIERIENPSDASELSRRLHTYKGLLAQFSFHCSPRFVHDVETRLAAEAAWTPQIVRDAVGADVLFAELKRDLASVTDVLGPDFAPSGRRVFLSQRQLQAIEQVARATLASDEGRAVSPPLRLLLQTLASVGMLDVKAALALHSRGAPALADRLQKRLAPIRVEGDDASLSPERYGEFFRSLVHVFRNAIDHGIEAPEERELAGKPADGSIICDVRDRGDWLDVVIEDDGRGVNRSALQDKLIAGGEERLKVESLSLEELVFREGLSSRSAANEVSGRGVGLAAVKAELDRLGGSASVETKQGVGTRFRFHLPTGTASAPARDIIAAERIAV
ncbi:MAG: ATP-binding protein [Hyphomonadaceae bacterium]|nr:ATP-binding protein [Hyphomonadaceae bacterium]